MTGMLKYRRVAQRLRESHNDGKFKISDIEDAVFIECGTDPRTVKAAIERMIRLKLITEVKKEREFGVENTREFTVSQTQNEYF